MVSSGYKKTPRLLAGEKYCIIFIRYVAGIAIKMCRDNWLDDVRDINIDELQNNCGINGLFELVNSISQ